MRHNTIKGSTRRKTTGVIALGFLLLIFSGMLLLMLPVSRAEGGFTNPVDALFTAVSATCVTGLVTVDTATYWSWFGQVVILVLIQIGGLGFMTLAVLMSLLIKRSVTPRERMLVAMSYNLKSYDGTGELLRRIWMGTLIIELSGALLLSFRFIPIFGFWDGAYKSIFISISSFCNAGFDVFGTYSGEFSSLAAFSGDMLVNLTVMLLIITGGIGFIVWNDIANMIVRRKHVSVYSRLVIIITLILIFGGALIIMILEWNNASTIGQMSVGKKVIASFFQSVTLRTAGFSTINQAGLTDSSKLISIVLMFIGGASGSTAGGVKVATVGVLFYSVLAISVGRKDAVLFKRKISVDSFMRAVAVISVQLLVLVAGTIAFTALADSEIISALFEATSAISTVGLSCGLTTQMNWIAKLTGIVLMYFGRVGVLTVTYAFMVNLRERQSVITYPDANMLIG